MGSTIMIGFGFKISGGVIVFASIVIIGGSGGAGRKGISAITLISNVHFEPSGT